MEPDRLARRSDSALTAAYAQCRPPAPSRSAGTGDGSASVPVDAGQLAALTEREREIAFLATVPTRSRDIARRRLGLSIRTVNNHLGRVYTKLGISSRAQLTARLANRPPAADRHQPRT